MIKKIIIVCLFILIILLVGCVTQEELLNCQKLCIDNNMSYSSSSVVWKNNAVYCSCEIINNRIIN